ncbi:MAG: 2-amino-3,7-dideoxy-D-threo-hept-6-ulosonate synthase [Candidatus Ranarchaeia archaeon]
MIGKKIRLKRISENGKFVFVPMDHGLTVGPIAGIEEIEKIISLVSKGGATAVVLHKGPIMHFTEPPDIPVLMHVSASTSLGSPNRKVVVGGPEEALRLGADGLSIHVNIGAKSEPEMLEEAGMLSDLCDGMGLPLLAMVYPRGPEIKNIYDPDTVAHVARIGYELGADIVKTVYTGDVDSFREVTRSCKVPVIIAGGPKIDNVHSLLKMVSGAISAGAKGVAFGRNIFQSQNPIKIVSAIRSLISEKQKLEEVLEEF